MCDGVLAHFFLEMAMVATNMRNFKATPRGWDWLGLCFFPRWVGLFL